MPYEWTNQMLHAAHIRASEKCNARRKAGKRTTSPSPTNSRMTTNGKASNNRSFDCDAFFFLRSFQPCDVLSFFYSLSCVLACPSLCLRLFATLDLRSASPLLSSYTHTISAQGHKKKKEQDKRERETSVVINGHFTH